MRQSCDCHTCDTVPIHRPTACRRVGKWFVRSHRVDDCHDGPDETWLCQKCFDAKVDKAKRTIAWGMEGVRAPLCGGCNRPLVRLSAILIDVEK